MYALIFSWLALPCTWYSMSSGPRSCAQPHKGLPAFIKYYLFLSGTRPEYPRYNPLQKLSYNIVWVMVLIQIITGAMLYWSSETMRAADYLGGLMAIKVLHDFMTYLFISYIIVHVYLVLSSDIRDLWAMINGYRYR
jgi:Ni/Fe-hydrogenase 1 B-type cytochrome subunit